VICGILLKIFSLGRPLSTLGAHYVPAPLMIPRLIVAYVVFLRAAADGFVEKTFHKTRRTGAVHNLPIVTPDGTASTPSIGGDIFYGADGIASFLYGDAGQLRKIYDLVKINRVPHFQLGAIIFARKSVLLARTAKSPRRAFRRLKSHSRHLFGIAWRKVQP
jgi:hypothetical protein